VPFSYDRQERFAGETKYPLKKMLRFAFDALTGFSSAPLKLATPMTPAHRAESSSAGDT